MSECDCPQCYGLAVHYTEVDGGACTASQEGSRDKPTTHDLLLLEVRDLVASVGQLREAMTVLEGRVRNLESGPSWVGGIGGLPGEVTISAPPEFRDWMNSLEDLE